MRGTVTGRWSSRNPNFKEVKPVSGAQFLAQSMAADDAMRKLRRELEAEGATFGEGAAFDTCYLLEADFSDIERRVMGSLEDDELEKLKARLL